VDCYRYDDVNNAGLCRICADKGREPTLMVVEKDVDIEGIEDSGAYRGRYFVLGGLMTLSDKKPRGAFRSAELRSRISRDGITEVIFALATTPEGDYTSRELMKEIQSADNAMRTTILGRGLSVGAEIEYADSETLRNALKNRA
jgi:recombination protein RecR